MKYDALLIIDVQTALIEECPFDEKMIISNIKRIMNTFREKNIPIIYVRHDGGKGDELEKGSRGWQIYDEITPEDNDKIIDKKYNSAFRQTELNQYLQAINARNIIICGMQTEYCIDATCKVAFEMGYHVTIPKKATTTYDNDFAKAEDLLEYYEEKIWNNRYAQILSVDEIIMNL